MIFTRQLRLVAQLYRGNFPRLTKLICGFHSLIISFITAHKELFRETDKEILPGIKLGDKEGTKCKLRVNFLVIAKN